MKNVQLTNFALGEEGVEPRDASSQITVEDVRKIARLIEGAFKLEAESEMPKFTGRRWMVVLAAAVAAFILIFGLPYIRVQHEGVSVGVDADAYAATFSPGADKEAIRKVVRDHLGELQKCYEDELP